MSCSGKKSSGNEEPFSLPAHRVRVSARARRIGLRVLPGTGLEVVLPRNADPACVPLLLTRHRVWIEKHLRRMPDGPSRHETACAVPERVLLKGGLEEIRIRRFLPDGTLPAATAADSEGPLADARTPRPSAHRSEADTCRPRPRVCDLVTGGQVVPRAQQCGDTTRGDDHLGECGGTRTRLLDALHRHPRHCMPPCPLEATSFAVTCVRAMAAR